MSWAELLKKSAEYARKSLEELAAALRPPPSRAPSYEPAYSKYRHRGFPHSSPQRRAYCTANLKHFFGSNAPGWFTHPSSELTRQQIELLQGIQHWPNDWHSRWHRNTYSHCHNLQMFNKWSSGWFSEWHGRWPAKSGAKWAEKQNYNWPKFFHAKLQKVLCPRGENNWRSVWNSNWHHSWDTTVHYNVRHSWNDFWGSELFNGKYNSQGGHQNDSGAYSWWTWSKEQHNRYHEWREQWPNHWQGRVFSWHHNTHDQWANRWKRNRQWRSEFPPYHHCRKQRRWRYSSRRHHPCFHPIWILLWFRIAVKCTNLALVRSKCYATPRPVSLNLSQKIPAILPAFCQHSNKKDMSPSVSKPSRVALFHTQAPTAYEELISYCERRLERSRVNCISLLDSGKQSLKSAYVAMTEYTEDSVAASLMSAWYALNEPHIEAEGTVATKFEEGSPELAALDGSTAAVDFTILPRLSFSGIAGLNDETVEQIRNAIFAHIASLHSVLEDINKIAELGELPVSLEQNGTVLRIHFPNSDVDRVALLTDDKGVESGDIVEVSSAPSSSSSLADSVSSSGSSSGSSSVSSLSASAESFIRVEAPLENNIGSLSSWSEGLIPAPREESLDELWSALHAQVPGLTDDPSTASDSTFPQTLATHD